MDFKHFFFLHRICFSFFLPFYFFFQFDSLMLFFYAIKPVNLFPSSQVLRKFFVIGFVLDDVKNLLVF